MVNQNAPIEHSQTAHPSSLLEGVEEAVCAALAIENCRHRSALHRLVLEENIDLAGAVYKAIASNWRGTAAHQRLRKSKQNRRWSLHPTIISHNRSPEVILERAIASACVRAGRDDWANQIPVCSGLVAGASDGRRAIDLIQRRSERHYEIVELKVGSDTPLYAAVEALSYSIIWLLTRAEKQEIANALLAAERVDVRVLAPPSFYQPFDLARLEWSVCCSLAKLGSQHGVEMTFGFDVLNPAVLPGPHLADDQLLAILSQRGPLLRRPVA